MNIWKTLQIEATDDVAKIKKAYAERIQQYNPEQYMQQFLEIRKAYQQALALAAQRVSAPDSPMEVAAEAAPAETESVPAEAEASPPAPEAAQPPVLRDFVNCVAEEAAEYVNCEAMVQLRTLYFEKKCSDKNQWIRYFSSAPFLSVFRKGGFTAQMKKELLEDGSKSNKAFFSLLPFVYGVTSDREKDRMNRGARGTVFFEGIEQIYELIQAANISVRMNDSTNIALANGYEDYRVLCDLAQSGVWNDGIAYAFGKVVDRYLSGDIYDKIPQNYVSLFAANYYPRHISTLQMLNHFCATAQLPQQAYQILWEKLDLKNAKMGRNQVLYGKLREICLGKYPELDAMETKSFAKFRTEIYQFINAYRRGDEGYTEEALDAFFQRDDLKQALRDRSFVEGEVLSWTTWENWTGVLRRLIAHCMADEQVVMRDELMRRARQTLYTVALEAAWKEDEEASISEEAISIQNRAFFRYLLWVSFPDTDNLRDAASLQSVLQGKFPFSQSWGERFLNYDPSTDSFGTPRKFSVRMNESRLDIVFHLFHVSYFLDDKPVYAPFIHFASVQQIEDDLLFWMVLPLAFAKLEQRSPVYEEILRRLGGLAYLQDAPLALFADCMTDQVCQSDEEEYIPPVLAIHRERFRVLYTCVIYTEDLLVQIYKTNEKGQHFYLAEEIGSDVQNAVWLGEQRLDLLTNPFDGAQLRNVPLPQDVRAALALSPPLAYSGEEVTLEKIRELLLLFRDQKLHRLELTWGKRRLVLMESEQRYACFGFDDAKDHCLTYLSRPDIYHTVDAKAVQYENFSYGRLPNYVIHATPLSILVGINESIDFISQQRPLSNESEQGWALEVYLHCRHKYAIEKCLLAGFPFVTPDLPLFAPFVLSEMPNELQITALDGSVERIPMTPANRPLASESLIGFLKGRLNELVLIWSHPTPDCDDFQRRLVLLSCGGCSVMLYSDSGSERVQGLVADVQAYLNLNTGEYKTQALCGYQIPDFMVHHDLYRIRGYLNVLLPTIANPQRILTIFGEFGLLPSAVN